MEKLKILLPGVSESDIQKYLESKGLSLDNLSETELQVIASDFSKITTSKPGKTAKTTKQGKSKQPANLPQAIAKVGQQTEQDINALFGAVEEGVEAFAEVKSDELLGVISEAPNRVVAYFAEKAEAYQGDAEGFRQRGQQIVGSIFASLQPSSTK